MGSESAPKTSGSGRIIQFAEPVLNVVKILPSHELGLSHVFVNKHGKPMNARKWSEHNWGGPLKTLGIRRQEFYATRHTFITEAIRRGENPLAVAQYCGMSLAMIQGDYCGRWACGSITIEPKSNRRPKIPCKIWLRGRDLNPGPQGYEPCELPDC